MPKYKQKLPTYARRTLFWKCFLHAQDYGIPQALKLKADSFYHDQYRLPSYIKPLPARPAFLTYIEEPYCATQRHNFDERVSGLHCCMRCGRRRSTRGHLRGASFPSFAASQHFESAFRYALLPTTDCASGTTLKQISEIAFPTFCCLLVVLDDALPPRQLRASCVCASPPW